MKNLTAIVVITILSISMLCLALSNVGAVSVPNENTLFSDNFEGYTVGTFPSSGGWELLFNGAGNQHQYVTDSQCASPTRSLQLLGASGWSAAAQRHFSYSDRYIGYEVSVMVSEFGYGGPGRTEYVGFYGLAAYAWGMPYATIQFYHDGRTIVTDDGRVVGTFDYGIWYTVQVLLDRETKTYSVWINDQLKGTDYPVGYGGAGTFPNNENIEYIDAFLLDEGHPSVKVYFDDVRVFQTNSIACALPANVRIEPQTLNLKSKGIFTAFVQLPDGYSIDDIDLSTVVCQGAPAVKANFAADTLILKFDRQALQEVLVGDDVIFTVSGRLGDGTAFSGQAIITVIK